MYTIHICDGIGHLSRSLAHSLSIDRRPCLRVCVCFTNWKSRILFANVQNFRWNIYEWGYQFDIKMYRINVCTITKAKLIVWHVYACVFFGWPVISIYGCMWVCVCAYNNPLTCCMCSDIVSSNKLRWIEHFDKLWALCSTCSCFLFLFFYSTSLSLARSVNPSSLYLSDWESGFGALSSTRCHIDRNINS